MSLSTEERLYQFYRLLKYFPPYFGSTKHLFIDEDSLFRRLKQVYSDAVLDLCDKLQLPEAEKAFIVVAFAEQSSGYSQGGHIKHHSILFSKAKFREQATRLLQLLESQIGKDQPHWMIRLVLQKDFRHQIKRDEKYTYKDREPGKFNKAIAQAFWTALHTLPPDEQARYDKNILQPAVEAHPQSWLAAPRVALSWWEFLRKGSRLPSSSLPTPTPADKQIVADQLAFYLNATTL